MRDQFLNDGRMEKICPSCNQYGHEVYDCPQIHFCVNRSVFSQRVFFSRKQQRGQKSSNSKSRTRVSWRSIFTSARKSLKQIRWTYILEQFDLSDKVNIDEYVNIQESDKSFFMRCPKLNQAKLLHSNKSFRMVNGKNILTFFLDNDSSVSESDGEDGSSDLQTDLSDSMLKTNKQIQGMQQYNSLINSILDVNLHPQHELVNQNESKNNNNLEKYHSVKMEKDEKSISLPNIMIETDSHNQEGKINEDQVIIPQTTVNLKSDSYIMNQDSLRSQEAKNQQAILCTPQLQLNPFSQRNENPEKDYFNLIRKQLRKKTAKTTTKINELQNLTEQTHYQVDRKNSSVYSTILTLLDRGQTNNFLKSSLTMNLNSLGNNHNTNKIPLNEGSDNFNSLELMIEKLQNECHRLKMRTLKSDSPSCQKGDVETPQHIRFSQKRRNIQETLVSPRDSFQNKSETSVHSAKKKQSEMEISQTNANRRLVKHNTLIYNYQHIFGKLEFSMDKLREFQIYYPKGNASNIIKIYKKIQLVNYSNTINKTTKCKQTYNSETVSPQNLIDKLNPQVNRILDVKNKLSIVFHQDQQQL